MHTDKATTHRRAAQPTVKQSTQPTENKIKNRWTSGNRYVYFSQEMEDLLKRYKEHCEREKEHHSPITNATYLFRRQDSELPMSPSTFTSKFKGIIRKHGLPENLNVHSLRHTNASLLIANGTDVATVAGLLGHSQVSTTLDIYTHSFDAKRKEASRALQETLERGSNP